MSATYTKKVKEILSRLDAGETREEIAEDYNNPSWKSLDIYMRRKDFRYNGEDYVPDEPEEKDAQMPAEAAVPASYFLFEIITSKLMFIVFIITIIHGIMVSFKVFQLC